MSTRLACLTVGVSLLISAPEAFAQTASTGSIIGAVRDNTGAVLPGVTVEASSPALIEKVRSAVTDGQGLYTIVNLSPGTYSVKFVLPGFTAVVQDGVQMSTGFTATVDAEMRVGAVTETITVTRASPLVDLRNTNQQAVLSRELLDALPTAQNYAGLAALTVGVVGARDVGGSSADGTGGLLAPSGANDGAQLVDGMVGGNTMNLNGAGRRFQFNQMAVQEVVLNTRGAGADTETGGVSTNAIMKEGGNTFRGSFDGEWAGPGLYNQNLSQELRDRGLTQVNDLRKIYAAGVGIGGPIVRDRAWFYGAYRDWTAEQYLAGLYYNRDTDPRRLFYTPDLNQRAFSSSPARDFSARFTFQPAAKHKISVFETTQKTCVGAFGACRFATTTQAPEAVTSPQIGPTFNVQGTWNYSISTRMLLEVGSAIRRAELVAERQPGVLLNDISVFDSFVNLRYNAVFGAPGIGGYGSRGPSTVRVHTGALNYISGTHEIKIGMSFFTGNQPNHGELNEPPIGYRFNNRVPTGIEMAASPNGESQTRTSNLGVYAQERWRLGRATLNFGVRYDHLNAWVPAGEQPATYFFPNPLQFADVRDVPNWRDISPRLGATYDVFGTGRMAIKGQLGRYVIGELSTIAQLNSPERRIQATAMRTWQDWDGDYVPDCDLRNFAGNGALGGPTGTTPECGAVPGNTFGRPVFTETFDPELLEGWYTRPYRWTSMIGFEYQLFPGVGLDVNYNRTWVGNFTVTDNRSRGPADYNESCVTAPTNAAIGAVSGTEICNLWDVTPTAAARANDNFVTHSSNFGKETDIYNGLDVILSGRFGKGGLASGGGTWGNRVTDNCEILVDEPGRRFCRQDIPSADFKFGVSYPLKWDIHAAVNYQNLLGPDYNATQVYTNAEIRQSLGRNLGVCLEQVVCNQNVTVILLEPNKQREPRAQQVDIRLSKLVRVGRVRVRGRFDIYNLMNADDVLTQIQTLATNFRRPATIIPGRTYKVGGNIEF